jgi:CRP/FNR family transcriptional regulator, cyclic AMP receptor protein
MLESIGEADLFEGVGEDVLREIARDSEELTFEQGAIVYGEGEVSENIYRLTEGSVDLIMLEAHIVHLTVSGTGQIFGWSALVQPYRRTATARCKTPTKVVKISRASIERIIESHPHEGLKILKNLAGIIARRLRDAYAYIHYYGKRNAP